MTTIVDRQIKLEEKMMQLGMDSYNSALRAAKEKGQESSTKYGVALVAHKVEAVASAITQFISDAKTGKAGRRHLAVKYLEQVDPKVAAMLALRNIIDGVSRQRLLQSTAIQLAGRIEDQVRYQGYDAEAPGLFRHVQKKLKGSTSYRHQRTVMNMTFNRQGLGTDAWPEVDRLHVGMKMIDIVIEATGFVQIQSIATRRNRTNNYLVPTPALTEWIDKKNSRCELLTPMLLPMVAKPRDWTSPFNGGYYLSAPENGGAFRMNLVKTRNHGYLEELSNRVDEMPMVYETVNALQRTAWKINQPVLDVMKTVWDTSMGIGGVPTKEHVASVPCPSCGGPVALKGAHVQREPHPCFEQDKHVHKKWKRRASIQYHENHRMLSKRLAFDRTLWVAEMFAEEAEFYMVYQLDFRGRVYAVPHLHPQGDDATKGLLTFGNGMRIGDTTGPGWLAIHGANVFGEDKISLEARIEWVEKNSDRIAATAVDPMSDLWWADADKPWQFLAFCYEWAGYLEQGADFVSSLPIALDGSCSGIQHFSAMLRDQRGGECVNLVPAEKPADIYQQVADLVIEKISADVCKDAPIASAAQALLDLGITRKSTKRQVMVLPYGGTTYSCREYTEQWIKEAILAQGSFPYATIEGESVVPNDPKEWFKITTYMSNLVWESIGEVVVAARSAMDWLQQCAKVAASEGLPINWRTPVGMPILQTYQNMKSRRVKTTLGDTMVYLTLHEATTEVDKGRMKSSVSPNFVHSMDAAHLMLSVATARDNDIEDFAMIHDSFGTHAANAELFGACLRHAFVEMYEEVDVLNTFRDSIIAMLPEERHDEVPPVPAKGSLCLQQVKQSDFFFA